MEKQNCQLTQSPITLQLRRIKNLKQVGLKKLKQEPSVLPKTINTDTSPTEKHVNQNVTVHASHKGMNNDSLVGISCKTEPISSAELPKTTETRGKRHKKIHSYIDKKSKISSTRSINVYCYTCDSTVTGKEIFKHLFFGQLKCAKCSTKILTCDRFSSMYCSKDICKNNGNGPHTFTNWVKDSSSYVQYYIHKELIIKRFCDDLKSPLPVCDVNRAAADYIRKLSALKSHCPWKMALNNCQYIMDIHKFPEHSAKWQAEFGSYYTGSCNVGMTTFSPKHPNSVKQIGQCSKAVGTSLTHAQENVLMTSKDENFTGTNTTKELIEFNKRMRLGQCSESDHNKTRGHANKKSVTPKNSDMIPCVGQYNKSVSNSLPHAQENLPAETNNLELKRSNEHMKGNRCNESDSAQHARLADDKCHVVYHPKEKCPEKCPECRCTLSVSRLTFDCSTFVMKIVCPDCAFPIHIKPDLNTKLTLKKRLIL